MHLLVSTTGPGSHWDSLLTSPDSVPHAAMPPVLAVQGSCRRHPTDRSC
jgi:hypothetical protein